MIDIKHEPQWPIIVFGNGVQAKAKRILPNIMEDTGIIVTDFHFVPTRPMEDYYNIKGADLNREGLITERYPQIDVIIPPSKKGTTIKTVFILQDYEGGPTPLSERFPNTKLIQRYQAENKILKAKIASLEDDIQLILTRPEEYIKKRVAMIKLARRAGGDMVDPGYMPETEMPASPPGGFEND